MDKKSYTEPRIVDYGTIAEMTAGQMNHKNADAVHPVGSNLEIESSGPCYKGYHSTASGCVPNS
jgi:hypothetical protein